MKIPALMSALVKPLAVKSSEVKPQAKSNQPLLNLFAGAKDQFTVSDLRTLNAARQPGGSGHTNPFQGN